MYLLYIWWNMPIIWQKIAQNFSERISQLKHYPFLSEGQSQRGQVVLPGKCPKGNILFYLCQHIGEVFAQVTFVYFIH